MPSLRPGPMATHSANAASDGSLCRGAAPRLRMPAGGLRRVDVLDRERKTMDRGRQAPALTRLLSQR
jgi:hypothetical protein